MKPQDIRAYAFGLGVMIVAGGVYAGILQLPGPWKPLPAIMLVACIVGYIIARTTERRP